MKLHFLSAALLALTIAAPAHAAGTGIDASKELQAAQASIDAEDFPSALARLGALVAEEPRNADALNLLGYASRQSGDLDAAARYYDATLSINPDHLGALEYQGEMFLIQGNIAAAEANLAKLSALCTDCEELLDLTEALADTSG